MNEANNMDNHFWKNRYCKVLLISTFNLGWNEHHTVNEFGQSAVTKLRAATGAVLS